MILLCPINIPVLVANVAIVPTYCVPCMGHLTRIKSYHPPRH